MLADNRVWFGRDGEGRPAIKRFLSEVKQGRVAQSLWPYTEVGHNQDAKKELLDRMKPSSLGAVFDTPKPTKLIRRMLQLATRSDSADIVMDFFAGSGTTADAVMQQNADDGGSRRFVMVQLDEELEPKSSSSDGGFTTIADLSRERIRSAGKKIAEQVGLRVDSFDVGFRTLKVDTTNMADVMRTPDETGQDQLEGLSDSVKFGRSSEDLLFQVLLDWGLELTMSKIGRAHV